MQVSPSAKSPPSLFVRAVNKSKVTGGIRAEPERSTPTTAPFAPLTSKPAPRPPEPLTAGTHGAPSIVTPNWKPAIPLHVAIYTKSVSPVLITSRNVWHMEKVGGRGGASGGQVSQVTGQLSPTIGTAAHKTALVAQPGPRGPTKSGSSAHTGNSGKACPAPSEPSGHAPEGPGGVGGVGSIGVGGGLGDGVSGGGGKLIGGGGKLGGVESGGHSPGTGAQGEKAKISEAPASDKMMSTRHVSPSGKGEPSLLVIAVSGPFDPTGMSALPDRSTPTTLPFAPLTSKPLPRKPLPLTAGVQGAPSMLIPNWKPATPTHVDR